MEPITACLAAICCFNKMIGCAIYDEVSNCIFADAIDVCNDDLDEIFNAVKDTYCPSLFLVHPKLISNASMLETLLCSTSGAPRYYNFMSVKNSSWQFETALNLICTKLIVKDSGAGKFPPDQNYQLLASTLNISCRALVSALGGLLSHMQATICHLDDGNVTVSSLQKLQLCSFLRLDSNAFRSLQIFNEEVHPNIIKGNQRNKEGFSLFALLDRTVSLPGRQKLRQWMTKPYCDIEKICNRQRAVGVFKELRNKEFVMETLRLLKHVHVVPQLLLRIKKVESTFHDWGSLMISLECSLQIVNLMQSYLTVQLCANGGNNNEDSEVINQYLAGIDVDLPWQVIDLLRRAIDLELGEQSGGIVIKEGYDPSLDSFRNAYEGLESILSEVAVQVLQVCPLLPTATVEYAPQLGYLIAIHESHVEFLQSCVVNDCDDADQHQQNSLQYHPPSFEFSHSRDGMHYFKHPLVYEMDDSIGDLQSIISDRQRSLLLILEEFVLDAEPQLQIMAVMLASLDATISLATIANELNFVKPQIVDADIIVIKNGRHTLQEMTVETFIPNDTFVSHDKNVAVVTGPNNSGKSVYVKQIGIMVYLAHIGSYLPCEQAIIGLTDRIYTRISNVESSASPLSSFAHDLTQVSSMLKSATHRSLCLLDEFGKGTTPVDGIALLAATVKHFVKLKAKTVLAIHFTEALDQQIMTEEDMESIIVYRMAVLVVSDAHKSTRGLLLDDCDDDTGGGYGDAVGCGLHHVPLYKLQMGLCSASEGISCAKAAGLNDAIISRAQQVKNCVLKNLVIEKVAPLSGDDHKSGLNSKAHRQLLRLFLNISDWHKFVEHENDIKSFQMKLL